jgi:predicted transcriptional regulator
MEHSLGLNGKKKLSGRRIAAKLGLSPSAVSQRGARIQQQLDLYEELGTSL